MQALERALQKGKPGIFNTDQGVQFTGREFTDCLESNEIRISQDGRGRALDNVFVERLWRSVKYEEVYLKDYQTLEQALKGLSAYFDFYNDQRPHQSLGYRVPKEVHFHREEQFLKALVA
jgi:putative transposase